jgi:hypothetical protein
MKQKIKLLAIAPIAALALSSCVAQYHMVTDNPIGNKVGEAKLGFFQKDADMSLEKAAKNGGITKIGLVQVKTTYILIIPFTKTIVYGE